MPIVQGLIDLIADIGLRFLLLWVNSLFTWFDTNMPVIGDAISLFLSASWDVLTGALSGAWGLVSSGILAFQNGIEDAIGFITGKIGDAMDAWNNLKNAFGHRRAYCNPRSMAKG
ncbi:MAG: hypothetical protein Q9P01_05775 [Anaerolineae bacterium]|nr:hypothetical protein [Anaerolineae bacterium]